jgi:2'-5' RNA ligase
MAAIARAFVAVEPPAAVIASVDARVRALQRARDAPGLRWGRHWHATLQFLGRVDDPAAVSEALARALGDVEPPTVRLGAAGAFPRARRGTVLWLGFTEGRDALSNLAGVVADATAPLGFAPEDRRSRFQPHVTVARAGSARDLRPLVDALADEPVGAEWCIRSVVLLASDTRPDGARYSEISCFPLRGESV